MRIVEFVIGVPTIIVVTAFPILARAADTDRQRLASAFQQLFDVLIVLSLLTAYGLVVGAEPAIAFLGGPDFAPAVPVLEIQGCAVAVTFFVTLFVYMLWALRATRHLVAVNLLGVCAAVVLTGALIPNWGARGAAIGMLIAESLLALALGTALLATRPELRPSLRTLGKALVALGVAAALAFLPVAPLVAVVIGAAAYLAILLALGAIPRDAWRALRAGRVPA
jgi:O-antigen/teichoic acid export membrane protein